MAEDEPTKFETVGELYDWLKSESPNTIILEGMEDALVSVTAAKPGLACLVYDKGLILRILSRDFEMGYDDAVVYFHRRLLPLWKQYKNPCYIERLGSNQE